MEGYTLSTANLNAHQVEIFTSTLVVQGTMVGPFVRTSDLVNRRDRNSLIVQDVSLAPLAQNASPKRIAEPVLVARKHMHFVAAGLTADNATDPYLSGPLTSGPTTTGLTTSNLSARLGAAGGLGVRRSPRPCHVFTSIFVISGLCHLIEGGSIESLLESQDPFFPLTQIIAYTHANPSSPWRRDLIFVNRELIQAIYTVEPKPSGREA